MAEHPGIVLTVIKFVAPPGKSLMMIMTESGGAGAGTGTGAIVVEMKDVGNGDDDDNDEAFMTKCMTQTQKNDQSTAISFEEKVVGSKADIIAALKSMSKSNLLLVGRMPPIVPLIDKSDCPELGPVGSFLASSDFSTTASILVVQQYDPTANLHSFVEEEDMLEEPDTPV
ncbi:Cation/H(+) antiporter 19 [Camellia lanceoleosa]|uniref:Cation/H(+) antiporter 19 n=1 Tax=Camellia lanceoleosa TaxID=1840588 RepID=A0ACC0I3R3_9ERIC|nr:Cation/H(+) antiporter 19 [Camellia lanceoleosa]